MTPSANGPASFPPPLDLTSDALRSAPYPVYRWYRENCPVYRLDPQSEGSPVRYLLTRFDDVECFLKHRGLVREQYQGLPWNRPIESVPPEQRPFAEVTRQWPLFLDPPRHAGPRRAINRFMTAEFIDRMREVVTDTATGLAGVLPDDSEFDAMNDFAGLVPLEVNRRALGLRHTTARELRLDGMRIIRAMGKRLNPGDLEQASLAVTRLLAQLESAIDEQTLHPDPEAEMLQGLLDAARRDGLIPEQQVPALAILLLLAALDTTANLIGNGIITFLDHRDQLEAFLGDPDLSATAALEVARFESPVQQVTRHAAEPLVIRDVSVAVGEGVSFLLGSANRDPDVYQDPDTFDIRRPKAKTSAFGHGIHRCPGEMLGLMEADAAWRAIFTRFPEMRLVHSQIDWLPLVTFRGAQTLPAIPGSRPPAKPLPGC